MIGKNNIYLRKLREGEKNESFSIKKFKVGAASVVIGASIFFGTGVASASNDGGKLEKDVSVEKVEKVENTIPKKDEGQLETETPLNNSPKAVNENSKEEEVVEKQVLDKTKLQASIVKVEELLGKINKNKVSASTLSAIQIDLETAKSIFTNEKTRQDEIDRAVKKLNEQSFILSSIPKGETPDKVLKKNGNTVSNSGSHDSRNGQSMGVGSQFRADSTTTSGALKNIKYFASVNPRGTTRNNKLKVHLK